MISSTPAIHPVVYAFKIRQFPQRETQIGRLQRRQRRAPFKLTGILYTFGHVSNNGYIKLSHNEHKAAYAACASR